MQTVVVRWARVECAPTDAALLDDNARERSERLRDDADRRRFVGARLLLRQVVIELVGCNETDFALHQSCARCGAAHGPPKVAIRGQQAPEVSMAHAGDIAIVAVARAAVGIDIERAQAAADTRRWVRTEAVLKATKHGFDVDESLLDLSPSTSRPKLTGWRGPGSRPALRLKDLDPDCDHVAAVARVGRRPLRLDVGAVELRLPA